MPKLRAPLESETASVTISPFASSVSPLRSAPSISHAVFAGSSEQLKMKGDGGTSSFPCEPPSPFVSVLRAGTLVGPRVSHVFSL